MNAPAILDEARDPLLIAENWKSEGKDVAIATVVETWGSAPRPVGSHLVIDAEGNFQARFPAAASKALSSPRHWTSSAPVRPGCWSSASPTRPHGGSACPAAAASRSIVERLG